MENIPKESLPENQKGISNNTVAMLVILALVITVIGTLAVISGTGTDNTESTQYSTNVGKVSFQILPSQPSSEETVTAVESSTG